MTDRPRPDIDAINRPYWESAGDGTLRLQRCPSCEHVPFPPRIRCPACFDELEWYEAPGTGTVYTYGEVFRPSQPDIFDDVPFLLTVIELDDGQRIVANLFDYATADIAIGDPVRVTFQGVDDDVALPQFELVAE